MNISFTKEQFSAVMFESATARNMMFDLLTNNPPLSTLERYKKEIRTRFPIFLHGEKIPAIKWLRETVKTTNELCAFEKAGYDIYLERNCLSLAGAKKFVEDARND